MGQYIAPLRDMQFVLHELLHVADELKVLPKHAEIDVDIINPVSYTHLTLPTTPYV